MHFSKMEEGFLYLIPPGAKAVAACPRLAVTDADGIVCSFSMNSGLGINDFVTWLARSFDGGSTWHVEGPIWPHLQSGQSIICSISKAPAGDLFLYGMRFPIDQPGESFWSDATQGMKQNELIWARSTDGGRSWTEPIPIPMLIPGSAEAPGAMCITRAGRWLACYAPYNTFDPALKVDRSQVALVYSDDEGRTWRYTPMLRFEEEYATAAEAWVIELSDGRLLGTCWKLNQRDVTDFPNAYALSYDSGTTWTPTRSAGIMGQATSLVALPDGRALFIYNQRKHGEIGVWIAAVNPTQDDFGVESNQIVWRAQTATQSGSSGEHSQWLDFSFGEPAAALLPDGTLLLVLWCIQPDGAGIRYVRLGISE